MFLGFSGSFHLISLNFRHFKGGKEEMSKNALREIFDWFQTEKGLCRCNYFHSSP